MLAELLDQIDVLVVGENDQGDDGSWPGREGAVAVTEQLARVRGEAVRYALPPVGFKDIRAWWSAQEIRVATPAIERTPTPPSARIPIIVIIVLPSAPAESGLRDDSAPRPSYPLPRCP